MSSILSAKLKIDLLLGDQPELKKILMGVLDDVGNAIMANKRKVDALEEKMLTLEANTVEKMLALDAYRAGQTPGAYLVDALESYKRSRPVEGAD